MAKFGGLKEAAGRVLLAGTLAVSTAECGSSNNDVTNVSSACRNALRSVAERAGGPPLKIHANVAPLECGRDKPGTFNVLQGGEIIFIPESVTPRAGIQIPSAAAVQRSISFGE